MDTSLFVLSYEKMFIVLHAQFNYYRISIYGRRLDGKIENYFLFFCAPFRV